MRNWLILIIFDMQHHEKAYVNKYSLAPLTLILLLHYFVKCRNGTLVVYNNEFILNFTMSQSIAMTWAKQSSFSSSSSRCCMLNIIKIGQHFTELFKK